MELNSVNETSIHRSIICDKNVQINKFKIVDLCAGTGAFSYAFHNISDKFETIYANDIEQSSEKIFKHNFPEIKFVCQDILSIQLDEIPKMDILLAGFSCQPFSIAGMKLGFDDERSNVLWRILEIMSYHKPRIVLMENVKNLLSHDKGNTFKKIKQSIEKIGYKIKYKVFNTYKLTGIPQNRERVFIVCFLFNKDYIDFSFPNENDNIVLKDYHELLDSYVNNDFYYSNKFKMFDKIVNQINDPNTIYQYRRFYIREYKYGICPTLTANMGTGGHNVPLIYDTKGIRKLTPRECLRLQGFPESYKIPKLSNSQLYKLAGNAISIPVVQKIAECILSVLQY